jgi:GTP-sensing pleiotropic transcriptional regulator CodY
MTLLKKGSILLRERNELKYQFVDAEKKAYSKALLCEVMQISRSRYLLGEKVKNRQDKERMSTLFLLFKQPMAVPVVAPELGH